MFVCLSPFISYSKLSISVWPLTLVTKTYYYLRKIEFNMKIEFDFLHFVQSILHPFSFYRYLPHGPLSSVLMSCMIWSYPSFKCNLPRHQNIIIASHRATRPDVRRTLRARVGAVSLINSTSHWTTGTTRHQSIYWHKWVLIFLLPVKFQ